jgi:hypothetical protein
LIDGGDELFPKQAPDPVILRDDRSAAEPATRAFSRNLSGVIAAIASDEGLAEVREYPRLAPVWELEFLAVFVVVLTLLCRAADFTRRLGFLVVAGVCLSVQWAALGMASVWLPGMAVLAAILAALVATRVIREMAPKPVPEIKILLAPVPKVAKPKAPAKKAAAKKVHAKKVPAKKAVRTKKPPSKS